MISTEDLRARFHSFAEVAGIASDWTAEDLSAFVETTVPETGGLPAESVLWIELVRTGFRVPEDVLRIKSPDGTTVQEVLMRDGFFGDDRHRIVEDIFRENAEGLKRTPGDYSRPVRNSFQGD